MSATTGSISFPNVAATRPEINPWIIAVTVTLAAFMELLDIATAASYAPPGGLQGMITGQISGGFGGVTESHTYNNSLEYTGTSATSSVGTALNLTLNYNLTGGDNGTLKTKTDARGITATHNYDGRVARTINPDTNLGAPSSVLEGGAFSSISSN